MRSRIEEIEARFGKPLAVILRDFYDKGMNQRAIARELGIGQATVSQWSKDCGLELEVKTVVVSPALSGQIEGNDHAK